MADDEKTTPTMEERMAALEAQLAEERGLRTKAEERAGLVERTLSALGRDREPPRQEQPGQRMSAMNVPPPTADQMAVLREIYPGESDAAITGYFKSAGVLFGLHAQPIVGQVYGVLGQTVDAVDLHNALLEVADYKPHRKEIEQLRNEYREQGRPLPSRAELTEIVKARKLPELIAAETTKAVAAERERSASAGSAATEAGGVEKVAPSAVRPGTEKNLAQLTPAERDAKLASMSREDRIKALEDSAGDTPLA